MAINTPSRKPTAAELSILQVLWNRGPSTVREVLDELAGETGYTTVLKLLQIMTEKGLVARNETQRTHVYSPKSPRETTQKQLVRDLLERAFGGSAKHLILSALASQKASPEELAEIRSVLDKLQSK